MRCENDHDRRPDGALLGFKDGRVRAFSCGSARYRLSASEAPFMTTQHTNIIRAVTVPGCSSVRKGAVRACESVARACPSAALGCATAIALIVTVSRPGVSGVAPLGRVATGLAQTAHPARAKGPAPQAKAPAPQAKAPQAAAPQTKTTTPAQVSTQAQPLNPVGGQRDGPPVTPKPGGPLTPSKSTYKVDAIEFFLTPDQFVEYKFRLNTGQRMIFNWKATGPVEVDFHTVPDGKPISASETYQRGQMSSGSGDYRSPYPGLHGWDWHNTGKEGGTIVLYPSRFCAETWMCCVDTDCDPTTFPLPSPPEN